MKEQKKVTAAKKAPMPGKPSARAQNTAAGVVKKTIRGPIIGNAKTALNSGLLGPVPAAKAVATRINKGARDAALAAEAKKQTASRKKNAGAALDSWKKSGAMSSDLSKKPAAPTSMEKREAAFKKNMAATAKAEGVKNYDADAAWARHKVKATVAKKKK